MIALTRGPLISFCRKTPDTLTIVLYVGTEDSILPTVEVGRASFSTNALARRGVCHLLLRDKDRRPVMKHSDPHEYLVVRLTTIMRYTPILDI